MQVNVFIVPRLFKEKRRDIVYSSDTTLGRQSYVQVNIFIVPRLFKEKRRDMVYSSNTTLGRQSYVQVNIFIVPRLFEEKQRDIIYSDFFFKLYRGLYHALKICMWFGYNP